MTGKIIIVGKGGSGKDTLKQRYKDRGFAVSVSHTARPRRVGEIDGVDYVFIPELKEGTNPYHLSNQDFHEYSIFNGWFYGVTHLSWHKDQIFIKTPSGLAKLTQYERSQCFVIFLDIDEGVRKERLSKRSDADTVERRMIADEEDFNGFKDYDLRITDPNF